MAAVNITVLVSYLTENLKLVLFISHGRRGNQPSGQPSIPLPFMGFNLLCYSLVRGVWPLTILPSYLPDSALLPRLCHMEFLRASS